MDNLVESSMLIAWLCAFPSLCSIKINESRNGKILRLMNAEWWCERRSHRWCAAFNRFPFPTATKQFFVCHQSAHSSCEFNAINYRMHWAIGFLLTRCVPTQRIGCHLLALTLHIRCALFTLISNIKWNGNGGMSVWLRARICASPTTTKSYDIDIMHMRTYLFSN